VIGGLPATIARGVVRHFSSARPSRVLPPELINGADSETVLISLANEGFVHGDREDAHGEVWWKATIQGNALAMASFGKPISRTTADRLATGLVDRARAFNADPSRLVYVERLRIFGSYLDPSVDPLGDLDVEILIGRRDPSPEAAVAYARASGRRFNTYLAELSWPRVELLQILRNRSAAINITEEDVSGLTNKVAVVYSIHDDAESVDPPDAAG
jgi:hypothetical protein